MTRELPTALEPIGRLDILDRVFENLSVYYESNNQHDPESLSRRADFLTQWSQICQPRGQTEKSENFLRQAFALSKKAADQPDPSARIFGSLLNAGNRLGEHLHENSQYDEGRKILTETQDRAIFALARFPNHPDLLNMRAVLTRTQALIASHQGESKIAISLFKKSLTQWEDVAPRLDQSIYNLHQTRIYAASTYFYLGQVYLGLQEPTLSQEQFQLFLAETEKLRALEPANKQYLREWVIACQSLAMNCVYFDSFDKNPILPLIREADTQINRLHNNDPDNNDPDNINWAMDQIYSARIQSDLADKLGDPDSADHWTREAKNRFDSLPPSPATNLQYLDAQIQTSRYLGSTSRLDDPAQKLLLLRKAVQLQIQSCNLSQRITDHETLHTLIEHLAWFIFQNHSPDKSRQWLSDIIPLLQIEVETSPDSLWTWSLASTRLRLASYQELLSAEDHHLLLSTYLGNTPPNSSPAHWKDHFHKHADLFSNLQREQLLVLVGKTYPGQEF